MGLMHLSALLLHNNTFLNKGVQSSGLHCAAHTRAHVRARAGARARAHTHIHTHTISYMLMSKCLLY